MPTPPANGVLLRRRTRSLVSPPDEFAVNEDWYDPATRTAANYLVDNSTDGSTYSRPAADVVDSWCLAPGFAPFTAREVHHHYSSPSAPVGSGTIDFIDVDNVTACQITCTLTLTATASAVIDGEGAIRATVGGAQGAYLLSLDDFQTPGVAPVTGNVYVFERLQPGTYTVKARETRAGGCSASALATLVTSYGPRYAVHYKDLDEANCLVELFQREYTGPVEELEAQQNPVSLDWPGGATDHVFTGLLRGSECELAFYLTYDEQLLPLFSGDERLHRVDYSRNGVLQWRGYLLPEQYDVAFLTPPAVFNLSATDGLGTLSDVPFVGLAGERLYGDWSLLRIIRFCLDKLSLNLPLHTLVNLFPATGPAGVPCLEQTLFDVGSYADDKGKAWDCGKVLTALLTGYQMRLYQEAGAWWLERLSELTADVMTYVAYAPDGRRTTDVARSLLVSVSPPANQPHWSEGGQRQSLRPAVAAVTVNVEEDELTNELTPALPTNADLPAALPVSWSTFAAGNTNPASTLIAAGKDKTPILRLLPVAPATTLELSSWVQTPPLAARTLSSTLSGEVYADHLTLSFKATPYGNAPAVSPTSQAAMAVAIKFGNIWLGNGPGQPDATSPVLKTVYFPDTKGVDVEIRWPRAVLLGPQPIQVRFYAPSGTPQACTVDLTELSLSWGLVDPTRPIDEQFSVSVYTAQTGQRVSRQDDQLTLFHTTTGASGRIERRTGTLLNAESVPTTGFYEPVSPGQVRELGDYLVRDRGLFQRAPAQALIGLLRGQLPGPGALLTDPSETRPAVYVLTSALHNTANATWDISAAQLLTVPAPPLTLPENAIYFDDLYAWQDEDGRILVYEDA